jgi:poly(3-hydroxybutyrate) depolymerase
MPYLETLERVFIDQHLAKGTMKVDNELISLSDIKDTKLLTIEGEMDDISGLGQTHAANYLCTNIPQNKKEAITFEGVGHYGIFAGKKWRNEIYSKIKNFIEN